MSASKPSTIPVSDNHFGKTDFAKVDAYVLVPDDYEEIPELTDDMMDRAVFKIGERVICRGRPRAEHPKKQVTIRLDADVLDGLRATGAGWQTRINEALRAWLEQRP